jgi:hypothetical protein
MSIILAQSEYQRPSDGYVNASKLCMYANRKISTYLRAYDTKKFLQTLSSDVQICTSLLVIVVKGNFTNGQEQGTWVHPRVAVHLGQWLSPDFAVLVSKWVIDWMSGTSQPKTKQILGRPTLPALKPAETYYSNARAHALKLAVPAERKEQIKVLQENEKNEAFLDSLHHSQWTQRELLENFLEAMDILVEECLVGQWHYRKYWYELDNAAVRTYHIAISEPQLVWGILTNRVDVPYTWGDIEDLATSLGKGIQEKENFITSPTSPKWIKKECLILNVGNSFYLHEANFSDSYERRIGRRLGYQPGFME